MATGKTGLERRACVALGRKVFAGGKSVLVGKGVCGVKRWPYFHPVCWTRTYKIALVHYPKQHCLFALSAKIFFRKSFKA